MAVTRMNPLVTKPDVGPVQALLLRLQYNHRLRQEDIEELTKIPQGRVSRWSRGQVPSSVDDVFKLIELEQRLEAEAAAKPTKTKAVK